MAANDNLVCRVCGDRLPKWSLDRFTDELCGPSCLRFEEGVAFAFGIVGMVEAIRRRPPPLVVKRDYWTTDDGRELFTCFCPGCGAYMKHLRAGIDEGTDNEWCGSCRY